MSMRSLVLGESDRGMTLSEKYQRLQIEESVLRENMADIERDFSGDIGWRRMSALAEQEFTRAGLIDMIDASRAMYLTNPLIQRGVDLTTFYTWGQGVTYQAQETMIQEEIIAPLVDNEMNREELFDHQAAVLTDVDEQIEGNTFFAMPTNFLGEVSVREIPTLQIKEIIRKPGDRVVMFYRRVWTEDVWSESLGTKQMVSRECLHPDWRWKPKTELAQNGSIPVKWDQPIVHMKSGGTKFMDFGVPMTYTSMAWARAYKDFLEDWHTLVKSLSRFAWKASGKEKPLKKLKEKARQVATGESPAEQTTEEGRRRRRGREVGDMLQAPKDVDISAINKSGTTTKAEDARMERLMVASGMNLPDTMLSGDAQQGALATAQTLDRPSELYFTHRQLFWASLKKSIFRYAVDSAVRYGTLAGKSETDFRTGSTIIIPSIDPTVQVMFPPVLEHDQKAVIEGINVASAFIPEKVTTKLSLEALGVDNIVAAEEEMDKEREERKKEAAEIAAAQANNEGDPEEEKELEEALHRVYEVLNAIK